MALIYELLLSIDRPIDDVRLFLLEEFDLKRINGQDGGPLMGIGFNTLHVEAPGTPRRETIKDSLELSPNCSLLFRLDKCDSGQAGKLRGYTALLQVAARILEHYEGDGALLFNGETVLFRRCGGALELNSEWEWRAEDLVLLPLQFSWRSFELL